MNRSYWIIITFCRLNQDTVDTYTIFIDFDGKLSKHMKHLSQSLSLLLETMSLLLPLDTVLHMLTVVRCIGQVTETSAMSAWDHTFRLPGNLSVTAWYVATTMTCYNPSLHIVH